MQEESQEKLRLRLESGAKAASKRDMPVPGRFMARDVFPQAVHLARQADVAVSVFGGYPEAERVQVCFHPSADEPVYTGTWLKITWNPRFAAPTHPELLGSLMGLGFDRSYFGDLIAGEQEAYLYAMPEMAIRLPSEWTQAGRTTIEVTVLTEPPVLSLPHGVMEEFSAASLRLDAVLAGALHISRARGADMIRQGLVMIAHQEETRIDRLLQAGDLISVRGHGRIRVNEIGGLSRKGRTYVRVECFLHDKKSR